MNSNPHSPNNKLSRRDFFRQSLMASSAGLLAGAPLVVPASVLGANAPSNRINFGAIGVGRMGLGDLKEILGFKQTHVLAVCDLDSNRTEYARRLVNKYYHNEDCKGYGDFRDLLARRDIDAVNIVTPDHWHVIPAIAAAKAGKDIFLQKPLSLTIHEGRVLSDTIKRYGRILQVGSQQRSDRKFRFACELVRNERIGKLHTVKVGFGTDPGCPVQPIMPVPKNLNYDMWLGQAPVKPYTEKRVHPQKGYGRPGWLRIMDYGHGMITGWGAHHLDIAQWGMGTEYSGPIEIKGETVYPKEGLWNVHGPFHIVYKYASGVQVICADTKKNPQGVRFEGDKGWVYVRRGFLDAHPKSLLTSTIGPQEIHLYKSNNHKGNFLECIKTRKEPVAPVEIGHRSCTVCLLGSIAMQTGRKLIWDPKTEKITNDPEAQAMTSRPKRPPWHL